jgi:hypothetical protein
LPRDRDLHDASGYWVLTGYKYQGTQSRQISPTDWPYFGSLVKMLKPSKELPAFSSMWLPDVMRLNDNVQPAGQTAGFLGKRWDPERIIGDPSGADFRIEGLALPDNVPPLRLSQRQSLLSQVGNHFDILERGPALQTYRRQQQDAFAVLTSGKARQAFDIDQEPRKLRERYGLNKWGQCVLLARRLIEAGVRLVHVNWPREGGDSAVDNPMWDTHAQNADRLQDTLCPIFDIGFTALIEDLEQRGLLSETLVVAIGEFGRTPRINAVAGRDHWGHVFSFALAGAGIRTAQVYGSSDRHGAYPHDNKLEPQDLTASIFHLLGIGHDAFFPHPTGRPIKVTEGELIHAVLGSGPATDRRQAPGGNLALVPTYEDALLLNAGFEDDQPLQRIGSGRRLKGWQATPLGEGFGVSLMESNKAQAGKKHALVGCDSQAKIQMPQGAQAILAQEIRHFRAGHYTLTLQMGGGGSSRKAFEENFLKHFTCRLVFYRHTEATKNPLKRQDAASLVVKPEFGEGPDSYQTVALAELFDSRVPNVNFRVGLGFGVALVVEKTSPGVLEVPAGTQAFVRVDEVRLVFRPRTRNDEVQV